jgi:hemolysin III
VFDSIQRQQREAIIQDSGPFYHEFHADAYIHEPWNAFSSLVFFIPVFYWIIRLRGEYQQHRIIVVMLPLLFLNGLGSTLYHAFRSNEFFLILDWLPASILSFTIAAYLWSKVIGTWYWGVLAVFMFNGISSFLFAWLRHLPNFEQFAPNVGYFVVGCSIFIPLLLQLFRNHFRFAYLVVLSALFLTIALLFRTMDYPTPNSLQQWLPQGTHFLWHIFSSFAVFSMGYYLYHTKSLEIKAQKMGT